MLGGRELPHGPGHRGRRGQHHPGVQGAARGLVLSASRSSPRLGSGSDTIWVVRGIAIQAAARLAASEVDRDELRGASTALVEALSESPVPETEWGSLVEVLGPELLADLLGISLSSLRRYATGARHTPDDVAARLHFLASVVADLSGTYNVRGVRRWFERPRSALGGRAPKDVLRERWDPDDEGPRAVRALARSLLAGSAT